LDLDSGRIDQTDETNGGDMAKHIPVATKSCGLEFRGLDQSAPWRELTVKRAIKGPGHTHGTGDFAVFVSK
jgi:hypothetical protein